MIVKSVRLRNSENINLDCNFAAFWKKKLFLLIFYHGPLTLQQDFLKICNTLIVVVIEYFYFTTTLTTTFTTTTTTTTTTAMLLLLLYYG